MAAVGEIAGVGGPGGIDVHVVDRAVAHIAGHVGSPELDLVQVVTRARILAEADALGGQGHHLSDAVRAVAVAPAHSACCQLLQLPLAPLKL